VLAHVRNRWRLPGALMAAALVLAPVPAVAEGECRLLHDPDELDLEALQFEEAPDFFEPLSPDVRYRLREVEFVRQNIFEAERTWLERTANRYNVTTRENVVMSLLPMEPGDPVDVRLLGEAERLLRRKAYLYDARVVPWRLCGDALDVVVVTRDVWTLDPQLNLARSGGENEVSIGISDSNLLGTGKALGVGYQRDVDRRGINLDYSDPNIGDSRWMLDLSLVDNDDGERLAAAINYPFYSLNTRRAFALSADHFTRDEGLYFLGDEAWTYGAETRNLRIAGGWSAGLRDGYVTRYLVGYAFEEYRFAFPEAFVTAFPDAPQPDRRFGYPFIAVERIEDHFDRRVNVDRIQQTEDLALGSRIYAELGYSSGATGGDDSSLLWQVTFDDAAWLTENQLVAFGAGFSGHYGLSDGKARNVRIDAQAAYRWRHAEQWSLLVRGSATLARNQTLDTQLLAGGEQGLRGYPNRFQAGDRRFLLTIEERYYSELYPFNLFRLGGAVFLDVGRSWYGRGAPDWIPDDRRGEEFGVLGNVGFGLRAESTRTRRDRVLHLDLSFPLRDGPGVGREITLSAKQTL
jgi:hypothetical protein